MVVDGSEVVRPAARPPLFAETKFLAPPLRPALVGRPQLVARLQAADALPLSIVVGPPGSGKSSLLGQWYAAHDDGSLVWLNADRGDDEPTRFWRGFIHAVQRVEPAFGEDANTLIALDGGITPDVLESILVDDAALDRRVRVVLDDFHLVSLQAAQQLQHLLARGLRHLRLLIGSRSDPAVGLPRLRTQGAVFELRESDLRLDLDESRDLVRAIGLDPGSIDLAELHARTEGWAAGLHLAALSVLGTDDPRARIHELAGTTQTIAGYLTSEVLSNQPPHVRRFLEQTCVPDVLDAALVEALVADGGDRPPVALEEIESANLLLQRLDTAGTIFRYHHLFAEMLRHRLQAQDPARFREQHRRAARALEARGDISSAVRHYWQAGDHSAANSLLRFRLVPLYLGTSGPPPIDLHVPLTDDELAASPGDAVGSAVAYILNGRPLAAAALLARADALAGEAPLVDRVHLVSARVPAEMSSGNCATALECAQRTVDLIHREGAELDDWTIMAISFGVRAAVWEGRFDDAERLMADLAAHTDAELSQIDTLGTLGLVDLERGEMNRAAEHARAAHAAAVALDVAGNGADVAARAVLGLARLEQGRLDEADTEFAFVMSSPRHERINVVLSAAIGKARSLRARGEFDGALHTIAAIRTHLGPSAANPSFAGRLALAEAALHLTMGAVDDAARLVDTAPEGFRTDLLRGWVAHLGGDQRAVAASIDRLAAVAVTRRQRVELAALRLRVTLEHAPSDAAHLADELIDLAEPAGITLLIAEAGTSVLKAVVGRARRRPRTPYVEQLLVTQPLPRPVDQARPEYRMDELSPRELVVLRYMATSMTNQEIADELYLSVNTVKTHIKHVLRKLHGTSRADAVHRAQTLHYL